MRSIIVLFGLLSLCLAVDQCSDTPSCPPSTCLSPDCACSGAGPSEIALEDRPHIVYLTFDDAFTKRARTSFYDDIFTGRYAIRNPNGDPVRATHFLRHQYTDYAEAHTYYARYGHEMASHSITHRDDLDQYWENLTVEGWKKEMGGMKDMMNIYGKIELSDIKGMRAPFLKAGGDNMIAAAIESNFEYDCSMPSREFGYINMENGLWPYTLDYKSTQDCNVVAKCPTCSYPGFWVQPMLDLEDENNRGAHEGRGEPCSMLDACIIPPTMEQSPVTVENMLLRSFNRSYYGNTRAPFGVYMHAAWFYDQSWHFEGYLNFLRTITNQDYYQDVWIVPVSAGIEYMKNPVPKDQVKYFKPFLLDKDNLPEFKCTTKKDCRYTNVRVEDLDQDEIYLHFCGTKCPRNYPYINNILGQ